LLDINLARLRRFGKSCGNELPGKSNLHSVFALGPVSAGLSSGLFAFVEFRCRAISTKFFDTSYSAQNLADDAGLAAWILLRTI